MSDREEIPPPTASLEHRFSAVLSISGLGNAQRVVLDGRDITRFVNRVELSMLPGEIMTVKLGMLLLEDGRPAVEIPEDLAYVVMQDDAELLYARTLLQSAIDLIESEKVFPLSDRQLEDLKAMKRLAEGPHVGEQAGDYGRRRHGHRG